MKTTLRQSEMQAEVFPPCIKALVKGLSDISSFGGYALITFLLDIGASVDEAVSSFKHNVDEKEVRHRMEYIAKEVHICPYCTTLQEEDLCVNRDEVCAEIEHPLDYYRIRLS